MHAFLVIFFRWLHVTTACVAIGGAFFMRILLPAGLGELEPEARRAAFLKIRRIFKMVIHTCILFLLVSGIYNSMGNWAIYNTIPQTAQPLWGTHVLLATAIFAIGIYALIGKEPQGKDANWMLVMLLLMLAATGVAAGLKYVRDNRPLPATTTPTLAARLETLFHLE